MVPDPPPAPFIKSVSPGLSPSVPATAMPPACGKHAAISSESPSGIRTISATDTQAYCANPPRTMTRSPMTLSPIENPVVFGPSLSTTPTISDPRTGCFGRIRPPTSRAYSGEPIRYSQSERFTPQARTSTRICDLTGSGIGISASRRCSGPPYLS